jgi:hypothetical protein
MRCIIDLPDYEMSINPKILQQQRPGLHRRWRESGNRRISPLEPFHNTFRNNDGWEIYQAAEMWITTRMSPYEMTSGPLRIRARSNNEDPYGIFEILLDHIIHANRTRDVEEVEAALERTYDLIKAVSNLIRFDLVGYGFGQRIYDEFFLAIIHFLPWFNQYTGRGSVIDVLSQVAQSNGYDPVTLGRMIRAAFSNTELEELRSILLPLRGQDRMTNAICVLIDNYI